VHGLVTQRRLAKFAAGIAQQAVDAGFGEASLPAPDRRSADLSQGSRIAQLPASVTLLLASVLVEPHWRSESRR
jgi:hypothetical protein